MFQGGSALAWRRIVARGIIEHDRNGLLVSEHDMNGASDHITRLYDDPSLRNRLSAAGIETISRGFTPTALCDRIEQACEDAVNQQALHMSG